MKVISTQDALDKAISIIRHSATPQEGKICLTESLNFLKFKHKRSYGFKIYCLTGMELDKIRNEYEENYGSIKDLEDILATSRRYQIIKALELLEIKEKYGDGKKK